MVCSKYTIPSSSARSDETEDQRVRRWRLSSPSLHSGRRQLGFLIDFDDGRTVDLIKAEYQSEVQAVCCQEVFKLWLKGPDATWGNLIELLIDCEQTALAC